MPADLQHGLFICESFVKAKCICLFGKHDLLT